MNTGKLSLKRGFVALRRNCFRVLDTFYVCLHRCSFIRNTWTSCR